MRSNVRSGLSLAEMLISVTIFTLVSVVAVASLDRESRALNRYATQTFSDGQLRSMLDRMESELDFAQVVSPGTWTTAGLDAAANVSLEVDTLGGFPSAGVLLLQPGTANEERIAYANVNVGANRFETLMRGSACGAGRLHPAGTFVRWAPAAEAIPDQLAPPASFFEGVAQEPSGGVFYRGDGTGFAFRVPVDPAGGADFFDADGNVRWGARLNGAELPGGFACFYFEPAGQVTEAQLGIDVNGDGDQADSFDRGRIRLRAWDAAAPAADPLDAALCPPNILQETCAYGADLDADGFQDPMFLWLPDIAKLHIRLLVLTETSGGAPTVQRLERSLFIPNGSAD